MEVTMDHIKEWLKNSGKTLRWLAGEMGLADPTIYAWSNGSKIAVTHQRHILRLMLDSILTEVAIEQMLIARDKLKLRSLDDLMFWAVRDELEKA